MIFKANKSVTPGVRSSIVTMTAAAKYLLMPSSESWRLVYHMSTSAPYEGWYFRNPPTSRREKSGGTCTNHACLKFH